MDKTSKHLIDCFASHIRKNFQDYCKRYKLEMSEDLFLSYLIDAELITANKISQYAIRHEFDLIHERHEQKTDAVKELSTRFRLSERTVWNALKNKK